MVVMEEVQQMEKLPVIKRKRLEVLLVESLGLLVEHLADLAEELFHRCRALSGSIHRQKLFDQPLIDLMEIPLEVRHCGNSPLLAAEEADSLD